MTERSPLRCEVIAEAGVNHNGDVRMAHHLVDVVADAGADCIKFQTFVTALLTTPDAPLATYQEHAAASTQRGLLDQLVLPDEAWPELVEHAADRQIDFLSTAFDIPSLERLLDLGISRLKIPSGELTNLPFVRQVASYNRPLLISTGMATLEEVGAALQAAAAAPAVTVLHCVSLYPAPLEVANLSAMTTIGDTFDVPVGWSDHTVGEISALGAVALGATVLEKHVTLDNSLTGPDHRASADPTAFHAYVAAVRALQSALGDGTKRPAPAELEMRRVARRSWYTTRALPAGHVLCENDLVALRPVSGIEPDVDPTGRELRRALPVGGALREDDLV